MLLDCTICTGMFGNGVLTLGTRITTVRLQMVKCGRIIVIVVIVCCGAVLGTTIQNPAVLRVATPFIRATGTTSILVFGLCVPLGRLLNPLLSSICLYNEPKFSAKPMRKRENELYQVLSILKNLGHLIRRSPCLIAPFTSTATQPRPSMNGC